SSQQKTFTFPASFIAAGTRAFVRQIIFQRAKKKRAKFAALRVRPAHRAMLEQMDKETLCQILRVGLGETQAAQISKERRPKIHAEIGNRDICLVDCWSGGGNLVQVGGWEGSLGVPAAFQKALRFHRGMVSAQRFFFHKTRMIPKTARKRQSFAGRFKNSSGTV